MASKALLVLALLLAATFLVASANEQAQAKEEKKADVQDWHGGGGYPGGGGGYPGGGGGRHGGAAATLAATAGGLLQPRVPWRLPVLLSP
ncbi:unnamed protein product [Miscanthus lutarioriparius]|uniref:Glycine-rich protein n=1 Tax=Miscanthus lutarioriparius TaxID=422564 RepID=A0A811PX84_9POAL|nr:unnamed protein product [Miscanthus lutarioriparius]